MNFTVIFLCSVFLPQFLSAPTSITKMITQNTGIIKSYSLETINSMTKTSNNIMSTMNSFLPEFSGRSFWKLPEPEKKSPPQEPPTPKVALPVVEDLIPEVPLDDKFFDQKRDHFHYNDRNKWPQRYLVYDHNYGGNGIIFLTIGTDQDITAWKMQNGNWYKICKSAKALCIGIELRGYGVSLPHGNLKDENLKYLNSEQAIADVASFIYNFRNEQTGFKLPEKLTWVAYGEGKQGALAAWLRLKYPHLVYATLSISPPLLATADFNGYFKYIKRTMIDTGARYLKTELRNAYKEIEEHFNKNQFNELGNIFNFCNKELLVDETNRKNNTDFMHLTFAHALATVLRFGEDYLKSVKNEMTNIISGQNGYSSLKPINRFALLVKVMSNTLHEGCLQLDYNVAISEYKKTTTNGGRQTLHYPLPQTFGDRTTLYQSCNEFGQFQTLDQFFDVSIDLSFYTKFCHAIFEDRYYPEGQLEKGVRRTNIFYGGLDLKVSDAMFLYGSSDPFGSISVISHFMWKTELFYIIGAQHCNEYNKLPETHYTVERIFSVLKSWLK